MQLSAPKNVTFLVALVLFVLGLLGQFSILAAVAAYAGWLLIAAFVVLALGVLLKGL
ncbi:MAG: hypothetical protein VB029_06545 [Anaerolineaceae bacterium]|jgi:amino acid transporter|nr:hypothetical protein [Anaerolineaceae bacterium]HNX46535.1 hypothetical protein [Anaerolineaceae bacterium]HPT23164.1 hypothetical protein [Anaerolineaceae bacterium]